MCGAKGVAVKVGREENKCGCTADDFDVVVSKDGGSDGDV